MDKNIDFLEPFISKPRSLVYLNYYTNETNETIRKEKAYNMYLWNMQISSAFLEIISIYEVSLRNALLKALEPKYRDYSIINDSFIRALKPGARPELFRAINEVSCSKKQYQLNMDCNNRPIPLRIDSNDVKPGKVVAELKFVFWENMLTNKNREIWIDHNKKVFPNMPRTSIEDRDRSITKIHEITSKIRSLRNRVCHHEPIFDELKTNLAELYSDMEKVFAYISVDLLEFVDSINRVKQLLKHKP